MKFVFSIASKYSSFMKYLITPYKKIFDYTGTSTRKEFWYFVLFNFLITAILSVLKSLMGFERLVDVYSILFLVPFVALGFRRLNEVGVSKWLFLIPIVNFVLASLEPKSLD